MNLLTPVFLLATITAEEVLSSKFHGPATLPVVLQNGYLADTHEVAAARSAHLTTLSYQSHGGRYGHNGGVHYTQHRHYGDLRSHRPIAIPQVLHDGHIADTHEVAAAKAEHFTAVANARAHGGYHHEGDYSGQHSTAGVHHGTHASYHGSIAIPQVLHDGHIADTHEVAAAKAEHFTAVANARAHGGYHHEGDYSGQYAAGYAGASGAHHGYGTHASYHGPTANPVVLPSGYLADTNDVAHAKQHHLQLLRSSKSASGHQIQYSRV